MSERRLFNFKDLWLLAGLAVFAALIFFVLSSNDAGSAEILIDGETVTVSLSADRDIVLESLPNVKFQVRDGGIAFVKSDCPDQICVRSGFLHRAGQAAACLPNRVSIIIIER